MPLPPMSTDTERRLNRHCVISHLSHPKTTYVTTISVISGYFTLTLFSPLSMALAVEIVKGCCSNLLKKCDFQTIHCSNKLLVGQLIVETSVSFE